jgi:hypothetical protein
MKLDAATVDKGRDCDLDSGGGGPPITPPAQSFCSLCYCEMHLLGCAIRCLYSAELSIHSNCISIVTFALHSNPNSSSFFLWISPQPHNTIHRLDNYTCQSTQSHPTE